MSVAQNSRYRDANEEHMNPKEVGEITEAKVLAELVELGYNVAEPFGENTRYDYIVDDDDDLYRVQVKTGRLDGGAISFDVCSTMSNSSGSREESYHGDIDAFAVWYDGSLYWVPIEDAPSAKMKLRIEPTKNNQSANINWADDYKIEPA